MKRKKKPAIPEITIGQPIGYINLGTDTPTSEYAQSVYAAAKMIALKMKIELPDILVIAKWDMPGDKRRIMSVTCNAPDAESIDLVNLLNIGYDNLNKRGLIRGLEPN